MILSRQCDTAVAVCGVSGIRGEAMKKPVVFCWSLLAAIALVPLAVTEEAEMAADGSGGFFGVSAGRLQHRALEHRCKELGRKGCSEFANSAQILGGYKFSNKVALEFGQVVTIDAFGVGEGTVPGNKNDDAEYRAGSVAFVMARPMNPQVDILVKLGYQFSFLDVQPESFNLEKKGTSGFWGLGVGYEVNKDYDIRFMADRYSLEGDRMDNLNVGIVRNF